jgi:hypothetical protein
VGDIGDFLNDQLEKLNAMDQKQREIEEKAFRETFRVIKEQLEDDAFSRYDKTKGRFLGGFLISAFEIVALGIGYSINTDGKNNEIEGIKERVQDIWLNPDFARYSGSGVRASVRIPKIVPLGRKTFANGSHSHAKRPAKRNGR